MWCWRRLEKISWTNRVRNEVLHRVKEETNIPHTIKRRRANWTGHIVRRNCLLKHIIEGMIEERIEVTGRRVRRRKGLLYDIKEKRGYGKLKEEALEGTLWIEGRIEVTGRRGRRRNGLLYNIKEKRGYGKLKEEALDGTLWIEGRIEGMGRRERRRKQLLCDLKETRGCCILKEEALDRTLWRTRFGKGYGPVVRQCNE
jgi:hypothetical protein